ncbi:MAG: hypothetical protein HQM13_13420 [SAR324 cluster bacterium]|nr:hypothetical protein [SAR324 cluster bacterium]
MSYIEHLRNLDSNHPIPDFFAGRLKRTQLILLIQRHKNGESAPEIIKTIQTAFNSTYRAYNDAVKKIGNSPNASEESTILIEFADLVYDFFQFAHNSLAIELPEAWIYKAFRKAEKSLRDAHPSPDVEELLPKIMDVLMKQG